MEKLSGIKISAKVVILIVGLVILAELLWVGWTLYGNKLGLLKSDTQSNQDSLFTMNNSLALKTTQNNYRVGDKIVVTVLENTAADKIDGTDIVLTFDPQLLTVENKQTPFKIGKLFDDYPLNRVDETQGKVFVSAITSQKDGTLANGEFGTVTFLAKAVGQARFSLDFTPGSTADSNITKAGNERDILEEVTNVEVEINE